MREKRKKGEELGFVVDLRRGQEKRKGKIRVVGVRGVW